LQGHEQPTRDQLNQAKNLSYSHAQDSVNTLFGTPKIEGQEAISGSSKAVKRQSDSTDESTKPDSATAPKADIAPAAKSDAWQPARAEPKPQPAGVAEQESSRSGSVPKPGAGNQETHGLNASTVRTAGLAIAEMGGGLVLAGVVSSWMGGAGLPLMIGGLGAEAVGSAMYYAGGRMSGDK